MFLPTAACGSIQPPLPGSSNHFKLYAFGLPFSSGRQVGRFPVQGVILWETDRCAGILLLLCSFASSAAW